jgi:ABC-type dipeptide/oligopeptide/nickel transport system permease subunit
VTAATTRLPLPLGEGRGEGAVPQIAPPRCRHFPLWRRFRRYPIGLVGAAIVILVGVLAISADFITPYDPAWQIDERLTPPNWDYILGLDEFGRDAYSRIIYGARVSLYAGIVSVIFIALPARGHHVRVPGSAAGDHPS